MIYFAILAVTLAVVLACLAFITRSIGPRAWSMPSRCSLVALVVSMAGVGAFGLARLVDDASDILQGTIQLFGLAMWTISIPFGIAAFTTIALALVHGERRSLVVPAALTSLAFAATWNHVVFDYALVP